MAVLVDITRVADARAHADFSFIVAEAAQAGLLRIDKATGEVTLLRPLLGATNGAAHFERAAHKIRQYWRRGVLPEAAIWAS